MERSILQEETDRDLERKVQRCEIRCRNKHCVVQLLQYRKPGESIVIQPLDPWIWIIRTETRTCETSRGVDSLQHSQRDAHSYFLTVDASMTHSSIESKCFCLTCRCWNHVARCHAGRQRVALQICRVPVAAVVERPLCCFFVPRRNVKMSGWRCAPKWLLQPWSLRLGFFGDEIHRNPTHSKSFQLIPNQHHAMSCPCFENLR